MTASIGQQLEERQRIGLLIKQGRDTSSVWTHNAIMNAKSENELNDEIIRLEAASISFLAVLQMNRMLQLNQPPEDAMKDTLRKIKSELMFCLSEKKKGKFTFHTTNKEGGESSGNENKKEEN